MNILLIGLGGFLGAISRYLLNELVIKYIPTNFPLGILIINSYFRNPFLNLI